MNKKEINIWEILALCILSSLYAVGIFSYALIMGFDRYKYEIGTVNFSYILLMLSFICAYIFSNSAYIRFTLRFSKLAMIICLIAYLGTLVYTKFYAELEHKTISLVVKELEFFKLLFQVSLGDVINNGAMAVINFFAQKNLLTSRLLYKDIQRINQTKNPLWKKLISSLFFILFSFLYALGVYFQAATASQTDSYHLGISELHSSIYPCIILLATSIFAYIFPKRSNIYFTLQLSKVAIIACLIILLVEFDFNLFKSCSLGHPTMLINLRQALLCPRFSFASSFKTMLSLIFALANFFCLKLVLELKAKNIKIFDYLKQLEL